MNCIKCNSELPDGSKFCKYCGAQQPVSMPVNIPEQSEEKKIVCQSCGQELPAGCKFCKYCGSSVGAVKEAAESSQPVMTPQPAPVPQPEHVPQPQLEHVPQPMPEPPKTVTCPRCGNELPLGSRFCKYCGTTLEAFHASGKEAIPIPLGKDSYQSEQKKNMGLLIGCIAAAMVVILVAIVLIVFVNKNKDSSESNDLTEISEDVESKETAEKDSDFKLFGDKEKEAAEEAEQQQTEEDKPSGEEEVVSDISDEEASYLAKLENGIGGTVDYNMVSYMPNTMDYYQQYDGELISRLYDYQEIYNHYMISGSLYSMSENLDLHVDVFYNPSTYKVERIVTAQQEDDHLRIYDMYFADGKVRMVWDYITKEYDPYGYNPYDKQYILLYTEDRLVELQIDRGDGSELESYRCADFLAMDDGVQGLFMAREANYLNRAYSTYAVVTQ